MAVLPASFPLMGAVLLLFVSAAWGSAFPLMKDLMIRMPVEDLLAARYGIAAVVLFAIRPSSLFHLPRGTWSKGALLGLMFGIGQTSQAIALHGLPASVSGFAVGCSVVITPLLGLLVLRTGLPVRTWIGVIFATAGMAVFTLLRGTEGSDISLAALGLTLFAAALYSGHTLVLGRVAGPGEVYALTVIQLATIGAINGVLALPDGLTLPDRPGDWWILAHLSIVSCALGFLARSLGQVYVAPVSASVLLSSQPLWVTLLAATLYGEAVTWSVAVGGGLMLAAMLLAVPSSETANSPPPTAPDPPLPPPGPAEEARPEAAVRAARVLSALLEPRPDPDDEAARVAERPDEAPPHRDAPPPAPAERPLVPEQREGVEGVDPLVRRALEIIRERGSPLTTENSRPGAARGGEVPTAEAGAGPAVPRCSDYPSHGEVSPGRLRWPTAVTIPGLIVE
ncbi:Permease of the drug/metabolite transporter (DMT) superfamily [Sinosporangium album]|uniref:Permease of the drug/metabolite transporter (DMT) superfamily n=1 Tax=Sinosporangium album TaxID=504805 RepID=A0A1G7T755_9ACTN|nr:DMT family transporter [Sinosporangium album]SDG31061.1 Permease of the drug/metabolite transporter (DMT) superfamily [Sinosporangium album]